MKQEPWPDDLSDLSGDNVHFYDDALTPALTPAPIPNHTFINSRLILQEQDGYFYIITSRSKVETLQLNDAISFVLTELKESHKLLSLTINCFNIEAIDLEKIIAALPFAKSLLEFALVNNSISIQAADLLANLIKQRNCSLRELTIINKSLDAETVEKIIKSLEFNVSLQSLKLKVNDATLNKTTPSLMKVMQYNYTITSFSLSEVHIVKLHEFIERNRVFFINAVYKLKAALPLNIDELNSITSNALPLCNKEWSTEVNQILADEKVWDNFLICTKIINPELYNKLPCLKNKYQQMVKATTSKDPSWQQNYKPMSRYACSYYRVPLNGALEERPSLIAGSRNGFLFKPYYNKGLSYDEVRSLCLENIMQHEEILASFSDPDEARAFDINASKDKFLSNIADRVAAQLNADANREIIPKPILNQVIGFKGKTAERSNLYEHSLILQNSFASFKIRNGTIPVQASLATNNASPITPEKRLPPLPPLLSTPSTASSSPISVNNYLDPPIPMKSPAHRDNATSVFKAPLPPIISCKLLNSSSTTIRINSKESESSFVRQLINTISPMPHGKVL